MGRFVASRDMAYADAAKKEKQEKLRKEREDPVRQQEAVEALFEAVADAFVQLMKEGDPFAFKYCPTPGCSADKATGSQPGGEGIAQAVMRRMGFPGIGLDHVSFCLCLCLFLLFLDLLLYSAL